MPDQTATLAAALRGTFTTEHLTQLHDDAANEQDSVTHTEPWGTLVDALFLAAHPRDTDPAAKRQCDALCRDIEADRDWLNALVEKIRDHVGDHGDGEIDVWSLRELLSHKPDQDHTNCTPDLCAVVTAPVPGSSRRVPEPAGLPPIEPVPGEHYWVSGRLTSCRWCGIVRRYDRANKPCKGPGRVELRAPEPADAGLLLESAWGVIANVGNPLGDWDSMPQEWREAAVEWVRGYHAWLDERRVAGESQAAEPAAPKLAQGGRRNGCGPACSEGHTYEAGCAIKPPARAFLGERPCGKPGCPCGGQS